MLEDVQPLGVGLHEPVLDPVVHHLHEMAGATGAAMKPSLFGLSGVAGTARRALRGIHARGEVVEHRLEPLDRLVVAADHHAEAALEAPDAAGDADVEVVEALLRQLAGAAQIVDVVRVPPVDDRVALLQVRREVGDDPVHDRGRHHHPDRARLVQLLDELLQRACGRVDVRVVGLHVVPALAQAVGHARAHAAEPHHSELH